MGGPAIGAASGMADGTVSLAQPGKNCLTANDWICGQYIRTRGSDLFGATVEHIWITGLSVLLALLLAIPLALVARRWRRLHGPVLGVTTVLYTVPSLAMYALLLPVFGLTAAVVVTGLVLYSLTVLVRNILAGLESVPEEAREAARGMGYGPGRLLFGVELPLALPALMAGVRIATVSAVSLTTVGAIVGFGGLGDLIYDGMDTFFKAEVLTASVICVLLAVVADVLLLLVQRALTPWAAGSRARRRRGRQAATAPGGGPDGGPEGGSDGLSDGGSDGGPASGAADDSGLVGAGKAGKAGGTGGDGSAGTIHASTEGA